MGPATTRKPNETPDLTFRRPTEADHLPVVRVLDDWWDARVHHLLPRFWFQHFTGTSWIAETADAHLAGFLVGFVSPDHPQEASVHLVGTSPNLRRRGIGRALYERFAADAAARAAREVRTAVWPGNRTAIAFHRALGFAVDDGPGTRLLYGTPAYTDYDQDGDDKAVFVRPI